MFLNMLSRVGKKEDLVFKKALPPHQYMYKYAILLIDTLSYIVYMGRVEIFV